MSETKSLAAPKDRFDRRAVVKGAAWSVPVIAAAIAAPAAAASPPSTGTVTLVLGASVTMAYSGATRKVGQAPTTFTIANTTAAQIEGTATFTITITLLTGSTGIRVTQFGATSVTMDAAGPNPVTITFPVAYKVPAGETQTLSIAYSQDATGNSAKAGTYRMDVAYSFPSLAMSSGTPTPTRQLTLTTTTAP